MKYRNDPSLPFLFPKCLSFFLVLSSWLYAQEDVFPPYALLQMQPIKQPVEWALQDITLTWKEGTRTLLAWKNSPATLYWFDGQGSITILPTDPEQESQLKTSLGVSVVTLPVQHLLVFSSDPDFLENLNPPQKETIPPPSRLPALDGWIKSPLWTVVQPEKAWVWIAQRDKDPPLLTWIMAESELTGLFYIRNLSGDLSIGRYVSVDMTKEDQKRVRRMLKKLRKRFSLPYHPQLPLGYMEVMFHREALRDSPRDYEVAMTVDLSRPTKEVKVNVHVQSDTIIPFSWIVLPSPFQITSVTHIDKPLPWVHSFEGVFVQPRAKGFSFTYQGPFIQKDEEKRLQFFSLGNWYPLFLQGRIRETRVTFLYPHKYTLITGGRMQSQTSTKKLKKATVYYPSDCSPIFALDYYKKMELETMGVHFTFYLKKINKRIARELLEKMSSIMIFLEKRFGPCPIKKFRIVELSHMDQAEALSTPGIIWITPSYLTGKWTILDLLKTLSDPTANTEFILTHEWMHQWWLVDPELFGKNPAFYEGLAQYVAAKYAGFRDGPKKYHTIMKWWDNHAYNRSSPYPEGWYLAPVIHSGALEMVDSDLATQLIYAKAPMAFAALEISMGEDRFFRFLKNLMQTYPKGITYQEFLAQLHKSPKPNGAWLFDDLMRTTHRLALTFTPSIRPNGNRWEVGGSLTVISHNIFPNWNIPFAAFYKDQPQKGLKEYIYGRIPIHGPSNQFSFTLREEVKEVKINPFGSFPVEIFPDKLQKGEDCLNLARYWAKQREWDQALDVLSKECAHIHDKELPELKAFYAWLCYKTRTKAISLSTQEGDEMVQYWKALNFAREKQWEKMHPLIKRINKKPSLKPFVYLLEAIEYQLQGQVEKAKKKVASYLDEAILLGEGEYWLSWLYWQWGEKDLGRYHLSKALKLGCPIESFMEAGILPQIHGKE